METSGAGRLTFVEISLILASSGNGKNPDPTKGDSRPSQKKLSPELLAIRTAISTYLVGALHRALLHVIHGIYPINFKYTQPKRL